MSYPPESPIVEVGEIEVACWGVQALKRKVDQCIVRACVVGLIPARSANSRYVLLRPTGFVQGVHAVCPNIRYRYPVRLHGVRA